MERLPAFAFSCSKIPSDCQEATDLRKINMPPKAIHIKSVVHSNFASIKLHLASATRLSLEHFLLSFPLSFGHSRTPMDLILPDDFFKTDLRTGTITEAHVFPEARKPAYLLKIDFGQELGVLQSSAQITECYTPDSLVGKKIIAVVNFPPRQIGPHISQCLVLGASDEWGAIRLLTTDSDVPNGQRIH